MAFFMCLSFKITVVCGCHWACNSGTKGSR